MKKRNSFLSLALLLTVLLCSAFLLEQFRTAHTPSNGNNAAALKGSSTTSLPPSPVVLAVTENSASHSATATDFDVYKLYLLINAYRKEQHRSPLLPHPSLEASAQLKLQDMIAKKYYRHQDATNTPSWYLFKKAHYDYTSAGENLSFGLQSPWQVFDGWKASAQHNEQLLSPNYRDMGVAADCTTFAQYPDGGCLVVLHLGAP